MDEVGTESAAGGVVVGTGWYLNNNAGRKQVCSRQENYGRELKARQCPTGAAMTVENVGFSKFVHESAPCLQIHTC